MKTNNKAFTLIELLVVVLIIGILSAVALPQYERAVEKSRLAEAKVILRHIADAQRVYFMANNSYAKNLTDLGVEIPGTLTYQSDRKETKFFLYGACRISPEGCFGLGFVSRLPYNTDYELWIDAETPDKIKCAELGTNPPHKGICARENF